LKALIGGTIASGASVGTSIASPSTFLAPAAVGGPAAAGSFVWSDQSVLGHSEQTLDWNNDYLVKNLPTDSQTLTK
jgi:hypothetical protein